MDTATGIGKETYYPGRQQTSKRVAEVVGVSRDFKLRLETVVLDVLVAFGVDVQ